MALKRKLIKIYAPVKEQGFLGQGHTARHLILGNFIDTDPFILLMDDNINKTDYNPVGGPHPHAGFETVSLLVDGKITEQEESMKKGDFQIMTAGSGIVHTETINAPTEGRLFQLWLNLPQKDRWTMPRLQMLPAEHVPVTQLDGVNLRLYSGTLDGQSSPVENYVPLIVAEISIDPRVSYTLKIPANFNTFLVVIGGSVKVGENKKSLERDQVGWLDHFEDEAESEFVLNTEDVGVRLVMYAALPLGEEIVSHGPFIADTSDEIQLLYREYRAGTMKHISTTPKNQRITY